MRWGILVGLAAVLGCASGPRNTLTPGYPGATRFLVCAPNTVVALPAELQSGTAMVREQIDAYLRFHERESQTLDLFTCQKFWSEAMAVAKEKGSLEQTPVFFARKLDEIYDFDALVMPSLIVHEERTANGYARWDGVSRRISVVKGASERKRKRDQQAEQAAIAGAAGNLLVTSLHVLVFTAAGERVFEGRGGIEFVHELDLSNFRRTRTPEFRIRENLPGGLDAVREGIAIAFDPLLPEAD
jgi:hypothetical protein